MENAIDFAGKIIMVLFMTKVISGYHFPWETCACCGKKYKDHKQFWD